MHALGLAACDRCVQVKWFRQGDLHPKFRFLIGYMMVSIVFLCICGLVYFHNNKK